MIDAELAVNHLLLRLRPIHRALRAAVTRQAQAAARLDRPDLTPLCVSDEHVSHLLDDVDPLVRLETPSDGHECTLSAEEHTEEQRLRDDARAQDGTLPLNRLAEEVGLREIEIHALVLCAAVELECAYERIIAYVLDDLNRRYPCAELVCNLFADGPRERLAQRHVIGRFGRLRRCGLVVPFGEAASELRTSLRLGPGVFDFLTGAGGEETALWRDPADIDLATEIRPSDPIGAVPLSRMGRALAEGALSVLGLWGPPDSGPDGAAAAVARAAGMPLRELLFDLPQAVSTGGDHSDTPPDGYPGWAKDGRAYDITARLAGAVQTAAALGTMLRLKTDALHDPQHRPLALRLANILAATRVPILLVGAEPWRPTSVLAARAYAEIDLCAPDWPARRAMWSRALPEADPARLGDLAGRFRMSPDEVTAVAKVAQTSARLNGNGAARAIEDQLEPATATVARRTGGRFVTVVKPRRGPDDLILPEDLHAQVIEIARFTRALPRVAETWGFDRMATGGGGIKALFTGDPGTGKTLAAEVIAKLLGTLLLKVNIAEIVSKWVGETEKNIDDAFREAASSRAPLYFDEADALFGRRGEIRHGVDRYANMEVSHLLQRLEDYDGLVILASNLKDNIDPAFTRRFHVIVPFPRPSPAERGRIWRIAFPPDAPLDDGVELDALTRLDMTGAAIVSAARTAALLAADRDTPTITMTHVVHGIARQYRRESRILTPAELGGHAALLQESL